jgi:hypothetical protein
MRAAEAAQIIREAIWRPGIEVVATPVTGSVIEVEIVFDTYDSSYVTREGKYWDRAMIAPSGMMPVDSFATADELLFHVLTWVREAQEHEDREFLRVWRDGRWHAPFHPHNPDGQDNWRTRGRQEAMAR